MANDSTQSQPMQIDTAKAHLGIATMLASKLLPNKKAMGQPMTQPTAQSATPQSTPEPAPQPPTNQTNQTDMANQMQGLESRIMVEIGALKEEIKQTGGQDTAKDLQDLKNQIQSIIDAQD